MLRFLCLMRTPPRVGFSSLVLRAEKGNHARTPNGSATKKEVRYRRSSSSRGRERPLQVFEARRNGSRLRPAVRAGEGEPEGKDSSEVVATELRRPFPPNPPPSLLRPFESASPGKLRAVSINPPAPSRPDPPSRRGRGWGCRAARSPPKAARRLPHAQFVLFSLFLFYNSTLKALPSCLPLFVCSPAPTAERIFSFFWFSTWKFRRELFRSKTVTAPQTIAESENDRDRRRPGRDRLRRARAQLAEGRRRCTCARRRPTGEWTR